MDSEALQLIAIGNVVVVFFFFHRVQTCKGKLDVCFYVLKKKHFRNAVDA